MGKFKSSAYFVITNFVTSLNIIFGFFSIIYSQHDKFQIAASFIVIAAVFDALDGKVASYLKAYSDFGMQYDSFCDLVSFGVAPAVLIYNYFDLPFSPLMIFVAGIPLYAGAIRLAIFNSTIETYEKSYFVGLPITASALTLASYILMIDYLPYSFEVKKLFAFFLIITLGGLMLSKVKYFAIPRFKKFGLIKFSFLAVAIILLIRIEKRLLFPFFIIFILYGMIKSFFRRGE